MLASRAYHGEHFTGDKLMLFLLLLFPGKISFDIEGDLNSQIRHVNLRKIGMPLRKTRGGCHFPYLP